MSAFTLPLATLLAGWAALYPARRRLGTWPYLALSWPVGVLSWTAAAALCSLAGVPMALPWAVVGAAVFSGVVAAAMHWTAKDAEGPDVPWWAYAAQAVAVIVVAAVVWRLRLYFSTDDSWYGYEALGLLLFDTGRLAQQLATSRNLLVPALHAANHALGGEVPVTTYAVTSLHLIATLAIAAWRTSFAGIERRVRVGATAGLCVALVTSDLFVFQSLYVHSHLLTAAYLLASVFCLVTAVRLPGREGLAWLLAGGLAAAGMGLARPDGPTYVYVVAALAVATLLRSGVTAERLAAFFAPLALTLALAFAPMLSQSGLWGGEKLTGAAAIAETGGLVLLALLTWAVARVPALRDRLSRPGVALGVGFGLTVAGAVAAALVRPAQFPIAVTTMARNLLFAGGWGHFWWFSLALAVLVLALPALRRSSASGGELLFVVGEFFVLAVVIHGLSHTGHLGLTDSFNRIAFHIVPIVWWVAASFLGSALRAARGCAILEPTIDLSESA